MRRGTQQWMGRNDSDDSRDSGGDNRSEEVDEESSASDGKAKEGG